MNYLEQVEKELRQLVSADKSDGEAFNKVAAFVKAKVLESYKNGLAAAKQGKTSCASQSKNTKSEA